MSCVNITNVCVLDNPTRFENPFQVTAHAAASFRVIDSPSRWRIVHLTSVAIPTW